MQATRLIIVLFILAMLTMVASAQAVTPAFDGYKLYHEAVDAFAQYHHSLRDPKTRANWRQAWYNKHDHDGQLDTAAGADKAVEEMMHSFREPFNFYLNPTEAQTEKNEEAGITGGIGVMVDLKGAGKVISSACPLEVKSVDQTGPAATAGIKAGDILIAVDGPVDGLTRAEVVSRLRGSIGAQVQVTYRRPDSSGSLSNAVSVSIVRAAMQIKAVSFQDLGDGISYIRLRSFDSGTCDEEMRQALTQAAKGRAVIIDLRYNRGGWVYKAMDIAEMFVPEGTIYIRRQRDGDDLVEKRFCVGDDYLIVQMALNGKPQFPLRVIDRVPQVLPTDMPVVVLVNEYTASAAEVLAGVLQIRVGATVVGTVTRGKGEGQKMVDLPYGRRLHVTNFSFAPGGQDINWTGVFPNIIVEQDDAVEEDKQLPVARKAALDLIQAKEDLERRRTNLKRQRQDNFHKKLPHP